MTYQESKNKLLQSYLDTYCKDKDSIEFIISSQCDQRCEYCYLQKHGHEMNYARANKKEDILHNLKLILDYLEKNNYEFTTYDVFSGEFFQLPYWEEVFEIFYNHQAKIKKDRFISMPTNYSFCGNEDHYQRVRYWIKKFKEVNCHVHLSCSIDGPQKTENITRPNNNKNLIKDDLFYDRVCKIMKEFSYSFHPMISKHFLEDYKTNYDWFVDKVLSYNILFKDRRENITYNPPMLLEVRDSDEWDDESLTNYKEFLKYVAKTDLEKFFNGDKSAFAIKIFDDFGDMYAKTTGAARSQPYILTYPHLIGNVMSCSIQHGLCVRVGDLTMAPCHRLYYSEFEYGHFVKNEEDTEIIGVNGINPMMAFKIMNFNPARSNLGCGSCKYRTFCLQGCFGSQYENAGEIFAIQDNVCKMFDVKYSTIHEICEEMGLYDEILNNETVPAERKEFILYAKRILSEQ